MVLPRAQSQPLAPLVRNERRREPRESAPLPRQEADRPRLGGGRNPGERRDDALAIELEDPLLLAAHEIDVELTDADRGELAELFDVLVDLAGDAETIDRFVVDECGIRGPRLGVMLVVIARAISDVRGEVGWESLLAVALHQIDDVVRYQSGEPADAIADLVPWTDVCRRGAHHRDRARIAAGLPRAVAEQADAPADEARVSELDDRAVGAPPGEL